MVKFDATAMTLPAPSTDSAALVTGASAGIGGAIAHALAARGHNVILVARRKERLDELAAELREQHGVEAEAIQCDLGDHSARGQLPDEVSQIGYHVDVLVNNAGFATSGPFHESDVDLIARKLKLLLKHQPLLLHRPKPANGKE